MNNTTKNRIRFDSWSRNEKIWPRTMKRIQQEMWLCEKSDTQGIVIENKICIFWYMAYAKTKIWHRKWDAWNYLGRQWIPVFLWEDFSICGNRNSHIIGEFRKKMTQKNYTSREVSFGKVIYYELCLRLSIVL